MYKKFALTSLATILVVGGLVFIKISQFKAMAAAGAAMGVPTEVVTAAPVRRDQWENTLQASGTAAAVQGVTVGTEAPGKIVRIAFESGQAVKAGDLLVQLDTSTEEAQLRAAEAAAALAQANLQRARELRQANTNSPAELDAADAQAKQARAQADALRAVIAKKSLRAPFTGRLGLRLVNLGQIARDGEAVATLQTLDPIYVNFSLPQQRVPALVPGVEVRVTGDGAPGEFMTGRITAVNPEIDQATRNVRVQATLANPRELVRPGMFLRVQVVLPEKTDVLAIPATAVLYAPYGDSVFVIETAKNEKTGQTEQVLRQQFVRLGAARGDFVRVIEGLKEGDQVVTSGVFKLRSGVPVRIDNTLQPPAEAQPKPRNA